MCHLEPQRLKQLSEWVGSYREFWEESFQRLDELLEDLQGPPRRVRFRGDRGQDDSRHRRQKEKERDHDQHPGTEITTPAGEPVIIVRRFFKAPPELVYPVV